MTKATPKRVSAMELAARVNEMRVAHAHLVRRSAELTQVWAEARVRRSVIREKRAKLLADLQLRRLNQMADDRRAAAMMLDAAMTVSGIDMTQLWLDYLALGGSASRRELEAMMAGGQPLDRAEHDRIALALNERLVDAGYSRMVAYWDGSH